MINDGVPVSEAEVAIRMLAVAKEEEGNCAQGNGRYPTCPQPYIQSTPYMRESPPPPLAISSITILNPGAVVVLVL